MAMVAEAQHRWRREERRMLEHVTAAVATETEEGVVRQEVVQAAEEALRCGHSSHYHPHTSHITLTPHPLTDHTAPSSQLTPQTTCINVHILTYSHRHTSHSHPHCNILTPSHCIIPTPSHLTLTPSHCNIPTPHTLTLQHPHTLTPHTLTLHYPHMSHPHTSHLTPHLHTYILTPSASHALTHHTLSHLTPSHITPHTLTHHTLTPHTLTERGMSPTKQLYRLCVRI